MNKLIYISLIFIASAFNLFGDEYDRLQEVTGVDRMMAQMEEQTIKNADAQIQGKMKNSKHPNKDQVVSELLAVNRTIFHDFMTSSDLKAFSKDMMKKYFTEPEVKELIKFYESDIGKKTLQVMPQCMNEIVAFIMQKQNGLQAKIIGEYDKVFLKYSKQSKEVSGKEEKVK